MGWVVSDVEALNQGWCEAWKRLETPWDLGAPHKATAFLLEKTRSLRVHSLDSSSVVLIPGAGRAHDSEVFLDQGMEVVAVDLAPEPAQWALERFKDHLASFSYEVGDLFEVVPGMSVEMVFDRAVLCALDPAQRLDYLKVMSEALVPGGFMLSIPFHQIDFSWRTPGETGPPYVLSVSEIRELFSRFFEILWMKISSFETGSETLLSEYLVVACKI